MTNERVYIAPGDLRTDLLELFAEQDQLDILLAAPGHLNTSFDGLSSIVEQPDRRIPSKAEFAFRSALLKYFSDQIDQLPQTKVWEQRIRQWIARVRAKDARIFLRPDLALFTRLISQTENSALFNGPLTVGRSESSPDLSFQLSGAAHQQARRWFEAHREKSNDISTEVEKILRQSWAGPFIDPEDLYYKVLVEYFWQTIEGLDVDTDDNPMREQLAQFQVDAYESAKQILRRYGGVFLADVVGLGKTFIGLALLKHLQLRHGEHAVVIAPPKVCLQWEELAAEFRIELQTVSHGKLEDLEQYRDREVLLIDESHNFRNTRAQRYESVMEWLRPEGASSSTKVILLSATPQNNHPDDVKNQLNFFPDNFSRLPFPGASLDEWFRQVNHGHASLRDLLQHVVVRRTRRFITTAYKDSTIRKRTTPGKYEEVALHFPTRVSGEEQSLRYSITAAYGGAMYDDILEMLQTMNYAIYGLSNYVREQHAERTELLGIRRAGRGIRGLFKVLMLKRLESSVHAFRISLEKFEHRLQAAIKRLDKGLVRVRSHEQINIDDDAGTFSDGDRDVPASWFETNRLRQEITDDYLQVGTLRARINHLGPAQDAKLQRLHAYLKHRSPQTHRTLIFTQFTDTAEYLSAQLDQTYGRTAMATGSSGNALKLARRFAPKANRIDNQLDPSEELDLLISTDVLSEGVNLQDANTLINYDIHWNPVRLIQRAGRIDRIGSENEEIHIASFLPEKELEQSLGLESVLRKRIEDFLKVFGEDSRVLPSEDQLVEDDILSAYTGDLLERADADDADLDGLSRHSGRLMTLRREDPERYNRVLELRMGRRAYSRGDLPMVSATKLGWYWKFWVPDQYGNARQLPDVQNGLDRFYLHACEGISEMHLDNANALDLSFSKFVESSRREFSVEADLLHQKRDRPQLNPAELFLIDALESYKNQCLATERELVKLLLEWVQSGFAQSQLRRTYRHWKKEKPAPQTVFSELRRLHQRHPLVEEDLGKPMVVGAVMGASGGD